MEARYAAARKPEDPPTFLGWLHRNEPNLADNAALQMGKVLMDHDRIGADINNFKWSTITTHGARFDLLTSDRPIVMPLSLGRKDAFILMPIGPRRAFLATRQPRSFDANDLTMRLNRAVVGAAIKYVYGTDEKQRSFIQKRFGSSPVERVLARLRRGANI
jgi:hypothetical protein